MEKLVKKISVLVSTYDGYSDLLENFINLLNENFFTDKVEIIIVNNVKKINHKNVRVINAGMDSTWSDRILYAMKYINTKYVLLLCEDYFITENVKINEFIELMNFIVQNNILYYKFMMNGFKSRKSEKKSIDVYRSFISKNQEYGISLQPSIWEKNYLKSRLNPKMSVWQFELSLSSDLSNGYYLNHVYDKRNILKIVHMVVQGYYLPNSIRKVEKYNVKIDLQKRKKMPLMKYIKYKVKLFIVQNISYKSKVFIKNILIKLGVDFVSEKNG